MGNGRDNRTEIKKNMEKEKNIYKKDDWQMKKTDNSTAKIVPCSPLRKR